MELDIADITSAVIGVIVALMVVGFLGFPIVDMVMSMTDNPTFQMMIPTVIIVALMTICIFPIYMLSSVMKKNR